MKNSIYLFSLSSLAIVIALSWTSCTSSSSNDQSPEITFVGMSKDKMIQGSLGLKDTLIVTLSFKDADGDLSGVPGNVIIRDNRNDEVHYVNTVPALPPTKDGNIGRMQLSIPTLCCIFDDGTPACETPMDRPTNTLTFDIYVIDAAGHESNRVTTPEIELKCI